MTCNGADRNCYENSNGTMVRKEIPVDADNSLIRQMIPRGPLTASEIEKGRTIYQYSSIMDYGQRWNSDVMELVSDTAAIRFGYGSLVDVCKTQDICDSVHQFAQAYGYNSDSQTSDNMETSSWNWGIFCVLLLELMIGVEANRQMDHMPEIGR